MPQPRLASDVIKDAITRWVANALKCELFPRDGDSLANVELPPFERIAYELSLRNVTDDTHVIRLITEDGKVYAIHVRYEGEAE